MSKVQRKPSLVRAILTDAHFWIPALALGIGAGLLVLLHQG